MYVEQVTNHIRITPSMFINDSRDEYSNKRCELSDLPYICIYSQGCDWQPTKKATLAQMNFEEK